MEKQLINKILFLRGNSFENSLGTTDIEVAFSFAKLFSTYILAKTKNFQIKSYDFKGAKVIEANYVNIPLIGALVFNINAFMHIKNHNFDVIIANPSLFIAAYLYKKIHRQSHVILDIRSIPVDSDAWRLCINNYYIKLALNSSILSGVSIITNPMANYLKDKGMLKKSIPIAHWGSGVNRSIFNHNIKRNKKYSDLLKGCTVILYHGTLSKSRGISNVIKTIQLFVNEGNKNIKLLLVGGGKDEKYLKDLVKELKLEQYVIFTGFVRYDTVPSLISIANLAIVPFPDLEWWSYQSPMKIYEYLSMGVPIIATNIPAHRNISKSIILISNNHPSTIKSAITSFLSLDNDSKSIIREKATLDSSKYTWDMQAKILLDFIEGILISK